MICFLDRTFCKNEGCDCGYPYLDEELKERAEKWWNPHDKPEKRGQAPIAYIVHKEAL